MFSLAMGRKKKTAATNTTTKTSNNRSDQNKSPPTLFSHLLGITMKGGILELSAQIIINKGHRHFLQ